MTLANSALMWYWGIIPSDTIASMTIRIFVTGGTFDKEYNEINGSLVFQGHTFAGDAEARTLQARSGYPDINVGRQFGNDR